MIYLLYPEQFILDNVGTEFTPFNQKRINKALDVAIMHLGYPQEIFAETDQEATNFVKGLVVKGGALCVVKYDERFGYDNYLLIKGRESIMVYGTDMCREKWEVKDDIIDRFTGKIYSIDSDI